MVKFRKLGEKDIRNDPLHRWLAYFDPASPEDLVEEVIKMDVAIQKAQERLTFVANDKEALREYHMREMALSDWASGVNHARREGRVEGRKEGRAEGQKEGRTEGAKEVFDLLSQGKTIEEARKILGLDSAN
jgi:predicted transposase/invertase (TIGR01784 family)